MSFVKNNTRINFASQPTIIIAIVHSVRRHKKEADFLDSKNVASSDLEGILYEKIMFDLIQQNCHDFHDESS